jgi:hypothetical protein
MRPRELLLHTLLILSQAVAVIGTIVAIVHTLHRW